jgi:hypothetical protein
MQIELQRRQSKSSLGTDAFDSEMLEMARDYQLKLALSQAKREIAAFIAAASWDQTSDRWGREG